MSSLNLDVGYALLDSGAGRKLECFGVHLVDRPCPVAIWPREASPDEWQRAEGVYERSSSGGGRWLPGSRLPESWNLQHGGLSLKVKPTGFGHLGVFPEQTANWQRIRRWCAAGARRIGRPVEVLNLFAYTGASTLAAAQADARVCHVDAAGGIVAWARENAELSKIPGDRVRWIVEDVKRFVEREARRGRTYDAIILDPPSYGRGKKGEVWQIERDLASLLALLAGLISPTPIFMLLSAHSPAVTPMVLANLLGAMMSQPAASAAIAALPRDGAIAECELAIAGDGMPLPSGSQASWVAEGLDEIAAIAIDNGATASSP